MTSKRRPRLRLEQLESRIAPGPLGLEVFGLGLGVFGGAPDSGLDSDLEDEDLESIYGVVKKAIGDKLSLGLRFRSTAVEFTEGPKKGISSLSTRLSLVPSIRLSKDLSLAGRVSLRGQDGSYFSNEPYESDSWGLSLDQLSMKYRLGDEIELTLGKLPNPLKTGFARDPDLCPEGLVLSVPLEYLESILGDQTSSTLRIAHYLDHDINGLNSAAQTSGELAVEGITLGKVKLGTALGYHHVHDVTGPLKGNSPDADFRYVAGAINASLDPEIGFIRAVNASAKASYNLAEGDASYGLRAGVVLPKGISLGASCASRDQNPFPFAVFQDSATGHAKGVVGLHAGLNLTELPGLKGIMPSGSNVTLGGNYYFVNPDKGSSFERYGAALSVNLSF